MFSNTYNQGGLRGAVVQQQPSFMDQISGAASGGAGMDIASMIQNNPELARQIIEIINSGNQGQPNQAPQTSSQGMFTNFNGRQKKESPLQKANDAMSIGSMLGGLFG